MSPSYPDRHPGSETTSYSGTPRSLDYPKYASRLKKYGTAIKSGESVVVTKVKVKSKHIEFQLAGGGYGTFGEETSSNVAVPEAPKTRRERNLEADPKRETDPAKRRAIREELDELKAERERENTRNRSPRSSASARPGLPRKGTSLQDVEAMLGPAAAAGERKEGRLRVQTREYDTDQGRVSTEFVEGVLIRYRMSSQ